MKRFLTASLLAAGLTFSFAGTADAANILFVGDGAASTASNILANNGHTVTQFNSATYGWNLSSNSGVDYAEAFDLVVVGRNVPFSSIRGHGAVWNALANPMINLNTYLVMADQTSANSWLWYVAPAGPTPPGVGASDTIDVLDPVNPIFAGVTLTPGTPPSVDLVANTLGARYGNVTGETLPSGVEILATKSGDATRVFIASAEAGTLQSGGGERIFIAGAANEGTYFTEAGEQVYLNAVTTLVPEPGSLALLGLGGLLIARRRRG